MWHQNCIHISYWEIISWHVWIHDLYKLGREPPSFQLCVPTNNGLHVNITNFFFFFSWELCGHLNYWWREDAVVVMKVVCRDAAFCDVVVLCKHVFQRFNHLKALSETSDPVFRIVYENRVTTVYKESVVEHWWNLLLFSEWRTRQANEH